MFSRTTMYIVFGLYLFFMLWAFAVVIWDVYKFEYLPQLGFFFGVLFFYIKAHRDEANWQ